jgi:DUF1365 family protein
MTVRAGGVSLYETQVRHVRGTPLINDFTYRSVQWLVDIDRLPVLPWWLRPLASFQARDHLGDPAASIRENLDAFLAAEKLYAPGMVLMLANARSFGHVFNPLTVYWCHDRSGELVCVVAEVHNTYGERHCYLLRTDERHRAEVPKAFYVSPFNPVDGLYRMSLPRPGDRLELSITLHREGNRPFVATVRGHRRPATQGQLLWCWLRRPFPTLAVVAQIRWQGIKLVMRRLPIVSRPPHETQETVR